MHAKGQVGQRSGVKFEVALTVVFMATTPAGKGKNKRCLDQPVVGGVATKPGELVWKLENGQVVRVKSRFQIGDDPERLIVAKNGVKVEPEWFGPEAELPEGTWGGFSTRSLMRAGANRRKGAGLAAATAGNNETLVERVGELRVKRVLEMGFDEPTFRALGELAQAVRAAGGRAIAVGGAPRDAVRGAQTGNPVKIKDADVEIYGIEPGVLFELVSRRWRVDETGMSFAVLKAHVPGAKEPLDITMPRRERAIGEGHRDFAVASDPFMSFAEAASRRDFTIGAMGYDVLTGELIDPYGGAADLAAGVLRHVSDAFDEDPLRVMRAARMAARFDMRVHPDTVARCLNLRGRAESVSKERRWGEIELSLAQATRPGRMLMVLDEVGWLDLFEPLAALKGVAQEPFWHPEGDVLIHSAEVLNYWGTHLKTGDEHEDLVIGVAAMLHDVGKATTTSVRDGRITSYGHDRAGGDIAVQMLEQYFQLGLAKEVRPLIEHHLAPVQLVKANAGDKAWRKLSVAVGRLDRLVSVARADQGGRPPKDPTEALEQCDVFIARAEALGVAQGPPKALARGEMLMEMGIKPGPVYAKLLGEVYQAQIGGRIKSENDAREMLKKIGKKWARS